MSLPRFVVSESSSDKLETTANGYFFKTQKLIKLRSIR